MKLTFEELCKELNVKPDYKHKKRQVEKFKRDYDIEMLKKDEYLYNGKLDRLYAIEHMDTNYGKNKKYLEPIIYTMLSNSQGNSVRCSMPNLLYNLKMVSAEFKKARYNSKKYECVLFEEDCMFNRVEAFTEQATSIMREMVKRMFDDMSDQQLIVVNKVYMYAKREVDKSNKIYTRTFEMTADDIEKFMEIRRQIMLDIYGKVKWSNLTFIQKIDVNKKTSSVLGYAYTYHDYELILNRHGLEDKIIDGNLEEFRDSFNKYVQEKILSSNRIGLRKMEDKDRQKCVDYLIKNNSK